MHEAHDALICIGTKSYINDKNRLKLSNQHYLKSHDEMSELFSDLPVALENNYLFPYKNNFRPTHSKPILPDIGFEKGVNADDLLIKLSVEGLKYKFINIFKIKKNEIDVNNNYKKYKERLDHEIKIILEMKYSSYFLIVSDYIIWAKKNNIPVGPGRGSGAGSLVAWCLSITDIDPIKFNLIFERFLNPDRISMPDFDIDFCEEKRDLVFKYLTTKYKDSVAHIITFGKLKARMVIRDVGRVLGLPYGFVDSICKMIPFDPSRPLKLQESINVEPRLQKLIHEDKRVERLVELSFKLEGLNRNVATHAAGVVIADKKLTETVPLYKDSDSDLLLPSTQFDMHSAENAGLVKFDFLGLKTLTVIRRTEDLINEKNKDFKIDKINYEDQKVFDLLSSGKTVGKRRRKNSEDSKRTSGNGYGNDHRHADQRLRHAPLRHRRGRMDRHRGERSAEERSRRRGRDTGGRQCGQLTSISERKNHAQAPSTLPDPGDAQHRTHAAGPGRGHDDPSAAAARRHDPDGCPVGRGP